MKLGSMVNYIPTESTTVRIIGICRTDFCGKEIENFTFVFMKLIGGESWYLLK